MPVGWGVLLLGCALGLGALAGQPAGAARRRSSGPGVAYMLWLAWTLAGSARLAQADPRRFDVGFWQGVVLQFVNIKAWMAALLISAGWISRGAATCGRAWPSCCRC